MPQSRQLAAIMFTDIVGYTALMGEDEQKAFELLKKNRELQKPVIEKYNGRWIKEIGDGVMASFTTVSDAVYAAQVIQQQCKQSGEFSLRIGIHHGEIVFDGDDVFGDAVNIASRIQAIAPVDGIWMSESVHQNVVNKKDISTRFVKTERLKNVSEPVRIYEVALNINETTSRKKSKDIGETIRKLPVRSLVIALIAIAVLTCAVFFINKSKALFSNSTIESIAVLPFVNQTGIAEAEYLSDGMTESLINSLSQLPHLSVKARSSVFRYKGKEVTPETVGEELNVHAVLNGQVVQRGDSLTLRLNLVNTRTGDQIWGEQYIRKQTDIISLQSEIARDVANKLRARLSGTDEQRVTKTYTADPEAYRIYLQGLYHWNKRTAENIRKSIMFFQQAIDKDPLYAKAYAGLAMAYLIVPGYIHNLTKQEVKEVDLKKRAAVRKAQELDESLPEVHAVLGSMKEDAWDFPAAEAEYRQAIKLNPNFASAHQFLARLLGGLGRYEEAFTEMNKAHEIDPFSISINFSIGGLFHNARRFDDAIAQFKKVLEMEPNHPLTHLLLARTYDAKGMYGEAIAEYRIADVLLEKETAETAQGKAAALTHALKTGGAQGYWRKRLQISEQEYNHSRGSAYEIAVNYARLGDRDRAFEWLKQSFAAHEAGWIWIKTESAFDALRSDPHFGDLLRRIGLQG